MSHNTFILNKFGYFEISIHQRIRKKKTCMIVTTKKYVKQKKTVFNIDTNQK